MEMSVGSRLKHAWNAFLGNEFFKYSHSLGPSYSYRPDRPIFSRGNERSIIPPSTTGSRWMRRRLGFSMSAWMTTAGLQR